MSMCKEDFSDFRPYRAAYNPEFLRRAKQRKAAEAMAIKVAAEKEATRLKEERRKLALEAATAEAIAVRAAAEAEAAALAKSLSEQVALDRACKVAEVQLAVLRRRAAKEAEKISVNAIIKDIAAAHGIPVALILGQGRSEYIVEARFDAIVAISNANPDWSLPRLGKIFKRDHTSILNALKKRGAWPRNPTPTGKDT
jgi:chromosomal replication initiation ATPase DnaA